MISRRTLLAALEVGYRRGSETRTARPTLRTFL
jgi:hypothetical protein